MKSSVTNLFLWDIAVLILIYLCMLYFCKSSCVLVISLPFSSTSVSHPVLGRWLWKCNRLQITSYPIYNAI